MEWGSAVIRNPWTKLYSTITIACQPSSTSYLSQQKHASSRWWTRRMLSGMLSWMNQAADWQRLKRHLGSIDIFVFHTAYHRCQNISAQDALGSWRPEWRLLYRGWCPDLWIWWYSRRRAVRSQQQLVLAIGMLQTVQHSPEQGQDEIKLWFSSLHVTQTEKIWIKSRQFNGGSHCEDATT